MANTKKRISESEKLELITLYQGGESSVKLAAKYGVTASSIVGRLKMWGIDRRKNGPKYSFNDFFFDNVDSEEKAYMLGFLYADGYNGEEKNSYGVAININKRDEELLHKFRTCLNSEHPISFDKRGCCTLIIHNKHFSQRLSELGCHRAKTFSIEFPEWMDESLYPHFIRGYNDGDGHIHFDEVKGVTVGALGTESFIRRTAEIIAKECGVHTSFRPHPKSSGILNYQVRGRDQVSTALAWLYRDATIYLERKKRKAELILTPVYYSAKPNGSACHLSVLTESDVILIKELILQGYANRQIKSKFNIGIGSINDIRMGRTWHHLTGWNESNNLGQGNPKGASHGMAKLCEKDVLEIKNLIQEGWLNIDIATRFDVSKDLISKIRCGKNWSHVTGFNYTFQGKARNGTSNINSKLSEENVREIRGLLSTGMSGKLIAERFKTTPTNISQIKVGKAWKHLNP